MDRQAIARAQRRRQVEEALEFERARADALREQLETIVAELDGPALDETVFAAMTPEDVAVVRPALYGAEDEPDDEWITLELESAEAESESDPVEEQEAEVARLAEAIDASVRRQQAFERYLEALGPVTGEPER